MENFVGRQKERSLLLEWLENDPTPMLSLVSVGGMGKSALSWYWLNEDLLKKGKKFDGVIWWSFYDKESSFERFLENSISYASGGKVNPKEIESTWDKMQVFFDLFRNANFFIVLDGLERLLRAYVGLGSPYQGDTVKEDENQDFRACIDPNVAKFLQWLSAGYPRTKTLITSRLFPKELDGIAGCRRVNLKLMDKDDAVEFFKRQGVEGTRSEIEEVCSVYGSHPLSLRLLSGMIVHDIKYGGDIKVWTKYNPLPELVPKEHNILELVYNSLDKKKQRFIRMISAFRSSVDYDAVAIFNDFGSEEEFNGVLLELVDRGLLFREGKSVKFDMHPIMRQYCYGRLKGKEEVHSRLMYYFARIPESEKIESVDDLVPVIELYHHTVRAGWYDVARELYRDRLAEQLYFKFGAYQTIIELLSAIFPDGENKLPRLEKESSQAWTLAEVANSYSLYGQPRRAALFYERHNKLREKTGDGMNLTTGLVNLAYQQTMIGELDAAESNLRQVEPGYGIECEERGEAIGHRGLGLLLTYRGNFKESEEELISALDLFRRRRKVQPLGMVQAYRSIRSLLLSNAKEALNYAINARELADVKHYERDIIQAEYLLGATYIMKGNLQEAEKHLTEALTRDRKINMVELEPDILLEFAKLKLTQDHKGEASKFAEEALLIADRCEYRLKQADIQRFLAEFYLDAGDLEKARKYCKIAKERAECGYKPALEKAEKLLNDIERR
jgi:tetratricopeptide (TPR) repeat protein